LDELYEVFLNLIIHATEVQSLKESDTLRKPSVQLLIDGEVKKNERVIYHLEKLNPFLTN
jgi:hypothetical protein